MYTKKAFKPRMTKPRMTADIGGTHYVFLDESQDRTKVGHPYNIATLTQLGDNEQCVFIDCYGCGRVKWSYTSQSFIPIKAYAGVNTFDKRVKAFTSSQLINETVAIVPLAKIPQKYYDKKKKGGHKKSKPKPSSDLENYIEEKKIDALEYRDAILKELEKAKKANNICQLSDHLSIGRIYFKVTEKNNTDKTKFALKRYLISKFSNITVGYNDDLFTVFF